MLTKEEKLEIKEDVRKSHRVFILISKCIIVVCAIINTAVFIYWLVS